MLILSEIKELEFQLRLHRKTVLSHIWEKLHDVDDPNALPMTSYSQADNGWIETDLLGGNDTLRLDHAFAEVRDIDVALMRIKTGTYAVPLT